MKPLEKKMHECVETVKKREREEHSEEKENHRLHVKNQRERLRK